MNTAPAGKPRAATATTARPLTTVEGTPAPEQPHMSITVLGISVEHSVISKTDGKFTKDFDGSERGTFTAPTQPGETRSTASTTRT
jgi:hypothetical protein